VYRKLIGLPVMVNFAHHVPGRLRVRISRLKRDMAAAQALRTELLQVEGVSSVSARTATGSIVIHYDDRRLDPGVLWDVLEDRGYRKEEKVRTGAAGSPVAGKLASAAVDHLARAAFDFALERAIGAPAATLVRALI
jgi:hypothetical protein